MQPRSSSPRSRASGRARVLEGVVVAALAALALGFRIHLDNSGGGRWTFLRNDETHYLALATDFLNGRWRVDYFINPTLYAYLAWAATVVLGGVCVLTGRFESFSAFRLEATLDPWWILMSQRVLSITAGVLAVIVIYVIGRRLRGPRTGFVAALALAVDATHVERSLIGVNEATMVLLVLAFYLALNAYVRAPTVARGVLAGALLGLACSTKYNAGVHALTLAVGVVLAARVASSRREAVRAGAAGFAAAPLAFLAGSPWALGNWPEFWRDFRKQASYLEEGFVPKERPEEVSGWRAYVARFPAENVGLGFSIACGAGLAYAVWRAVRWRDPRAALLLAAILPAYAFLGSGTFVMMRFLLPSIPFVLLAGAWVTDVAAERVAGALGRSQSAASRGAVATAFAATFAIAALAPHAVATWRASWTQFGRTDGRAQAEPLVREIVPPAVPLLDLVHPPVLRFFDDHAYLRRYGLGESALATPTERERWREFERTAIRTTELGEVVARARDMQAFRQRIAAEGYVALVVASLTEKGLRQRRDLAPATVDATRRRVLQRMRAHDPVLRRCEYWDELLQFLLDLEPAALRLTRSRGIFLAVLAIPEAPR